MKTILSSLLFGAALFAQTSQPIQPIVIVPASVAGSIIVTSADGTAKTYSISLPPAAIAAMAQFIADTTAVTTANGATTAVPKYQDAGDLIVQHLSVSLIGPLVAKYPPPAVQSAAQTAAAAQTALVNATVAAAQGTVTVK